MKLRMKFCLLGVLLIAVGCGGSAGLSGSTGSNGYGPSAISVPTSGPGGSGSIGVGALFITDDLDDHSHVWVTIKKVVLASASGNVAIYDDPTGVTIDLKTLRDTNGQRYSFLANAPAGAYTSIHVTVDKTVTLYAKGSNTGQTRVFAGNDGANAVLSLTFAKPKTISTGANFVLDFHLSGWSDDGTTVTGTPFLAIANAPGLDDPSRFEHNDYRGTVSGLAGAGPNLTFNLTLADQTTKVVTNSSTTIYNVSGAANPNLANGQKLEIHGAYEVAQKALLADSIRVEDATTPAPAKVQGATSDTNSADGKLVIAANCVRDFTPANSGVTVTTDGTTVFVGLDGSTLTRATFFTDLAKAGFAEAEGTYVASTNTLAATTIRLQSDRPGTGHGDRR